MKTNYLTHDDVYKKLLVEGKVGWDGTEQAYQRHKQQLREILDSDLTPSSGKILELGCGAGNISIWLAQRGYEVTGVDISPTAVSWAEHKVKTENISIDFKVRDVLDLEGLDKNSFDIVLDGHCFHCIIGPDRFKFLSEAFRVLKPGGLFIVNTMCGPVKPGKIENYDHHTKCVFYNDLAVRYIGLPDDIRAEVKSAGFKIITEQLRPDESNNDIIIQAVKPDKHKGSSSHCFSPVFYITD